MLTSLFRHVCAIGHTFGVEGVESGVVVEVDRLNALAAADCHKRVMEIYMLQFILAKLRLFSLSHRR